MNRLRIELNVPANGSKACNALNRLSHDVDGKTLRPGQSFLIVDDAAKPIGLARVEEIPRTTGEHAAGLLGVIIADTRERIGIRRLAAVFEEMTGEHFHLATWHRWLASDPAKRMEPAIGTALAIAAAHARILREDAAKAVKQAVAEVMAREGKP